MSKYQVKEEGEFKYLETGGGGVPLVLLHGLFGALSNFNTIIDYFGKQRTVIVPILPIFEGPLRVPTVTDLVKYVRRFIDKRGYKKIHVMGNSLGGHLAILYALAEPERVESLVLTGSSGLYESAFGSTFPRRGSYEYVKERTEAVFYDPAVATKELIDEIFDVVNDRSKALRVLMTAKSAIRHNIADKLHNIKAPTLLIWGKQDDITPPEAAEKFDELIENTQLIFIDECKHAPMMEHPERFNELLDNFLKEVESRYEDEATEPLEERK